MIETLLKELISTKEDLTFAGAYDLLYQAQMFEYLSTKDKRCRGLLRYCKDSLNRSELDKRLSNCSSGLSSNSSYSFIEDYSLTYLVKYLFGIHFLFKWFYPAKHKKQKRKFILVSLSFVNNFDLGISWLITFQSELKLANKNIVVYSHLDDINKLDYSLRLAFKTKSRGPFSIDKDYNVWKHHNLNPSLYKSVSHSSFVI